MDQDQFVSSRFPNRRRATQACVPCRTRKTRCDAAQPKCGYCAQHNVECIYREAQQPRIDHGTQVILERIQLLEDRLTSVQLVDATPAASVLPSRPTQAQPPQNTEAEPEGRIASSHTANANHVHDWPIVRHLLSEAPGLELQLAGGATDIFFESPTQMRPPPSSWRLFEHFSSASNLEYQRLIEIYFAEVNVIFPLLSSDDLYLIYGQVVTEHTAEWQETRTSVRVGEYALLMLVLTMATYVSKGCNKVMLSLNPMPDDPQEDLLWSKAVLLLGPVSSEMSIIAAQCLMLASLYRGAKGRVAESFHWSHLAAVKCDALAHSYIHVKHIRPPDEFARLFWVAYIYESDFVSEVSLNQPSGIVRYEDLIPYPTVKELADGRASAESVAIARQEELVAFQITTNASIRRFLNRVNSTVYSPAEHLHHQGSDYAAWLLRLTADLWSHHAAVYNNLPEFLLTSYQNDAPIADSPTAHIEGLLPRGNNPWNIVRLKGRYYAGQYIIHRPFVEYALLNTDRLESHPAKHSILNGCLMCIEGCAGFIRVFNVDPANSITGLFAGGMVTFTMITILMVSTITPAMSSIVPHDVEESIITGVHNLRRFSNSVREFSWHLNILERLDISRKARLVGSNV
uniref:Zn(2)-C6 fungal-type domain-containing protein n=2 Tax=Bionectria ochroleuca TaxID=29856 RepID=A0A0B7KCB1_BIOOC